MQSTSLFCLLSSTSYNTLPSLIRPWYTLQYPLRYNMIQFFALPRGFALHYKLGKNWSSRRRRERNLDKNLASPLQIFDNFDLIWTDSNIRKQVNKREIETVDLLIEYLVSNQYWWRQKLQIILSLYQCSSLYSDPLNTSFHIYCQRLQCRRRSTMERLGWFICPLSDPAIFNPIYIKLYHAVFSHNLFWKRH